jgi:rod shape-determining protein MreC
MLFTSGEDRVFPKGLPVGKVTGVREGGNFQDITVQPSGTETAPEEVLVILDPVPEEIPDEPPADVPVFLAPAVNPGAQAPVTGTPKTTADKLMEEYKKIGDAQKHVFGVGGPGTPPPNFNLKVPGVNAPAAPVGATAASSAPETKNATTVPGSGPAATSPPKPKPPALPPAPQSAPPQVSPVQPKPTPVAPSPETEPQH